MNKKGMSILTLAIILISLTIGLAITSQVGFDIEKFKTDLHWKNINMTIPEQPEIQNALNYYVNGLGAAYFEIIKWVAQWSYENPQVPYKLLIWLLLLSILAPLILVLFKVLVIVFLLIKEWIQSRKEKRELKRYEK